MVEILKIAGSLGVGALLAVIIFIMYRNDRKTSEDQLRQNGKNHEEQLRQDRKFMEDRMNRIIERDQMTREANTKALSELTTVLERMNGRK